MEYSNKDFVSFGDVLSHALVLCRDQKLRNGMTRGWYVSLIQRALEELAFTTFYDEITEDLPLPECLQMDVPCNMFNIRLIYLFNGKCSPESSVKVYWKRNFNNKPGGINYTANRKDTTNNFDPYFPQDFINSNVYYAGEQNGLLMFSANAKGWEKVRLIGNGAGTPIGDDPVIPRFFRTTICDYVAETYFRVRMADERAFSVDQQVYELRLHGRNGDGGSWKEAERRVKKLGSWKKETLKITQEGNWDYNGGWGGGVS